MSGLEHATQTQGITSKLLPGEGRDREARSPDVLGQQQGVGQRKRKQPGGRAMGAEALNHPERRLPMFPGLYWRAVKPP